MKTVESVRRLALWLLELFPLTGIAVHQVIVKNDHICWRWPRDEDDPYDELILILYCAKREFFEKIAVPKLKENIEGIEISYEFISGDRIVVSFLSSPLRSVREIYHERDRICELGLRGKLGDREAQIDRHVVLPQTWKELNDRSTRVYT